MAITAVVNIQVADGKAAEALTLMKRSQTACQGIEACEAFEILESDGDPHHFVLVETWRSVGDHKQFLEGLLSDPKFREEIKIFDSGPDIEYFNVR